MSIWTTEQIIKNPTTDMDCVCVCGGGGYGVVVMVNSNCNWPKLNALHSVSVIY